MRIIERYRECSIAGQVAWVSGVLGLLTIVLLAGIPSNRESVNSRQGNSESPASNSSLDNGKGIESFSFEFNLAADRKSALVTESYKIPAYQDGRIGMVRNLAQKFGGRSDKRSEVSVEVLKVSRKDLSEPQSENLTVPFTTSPNGSVLQARIGADGPPSEKGHIYELTLQYRLNYKSTRDNSEKVYWRITSGIPRPIGAISGSIKLDGGGKAAVNELRWDYGKLFKALTLSAPIPLKINETGSAVFSWNGPLTKELGEIAIEVE